MWKDLVELKKSHKIFSKCNSEHELSIADMDKKAYNYYLTDYVKAA